MRALIILALLATPLYADVSGEDEETAPISQEQEVQPEPAPVEQAAPETAPPQTIEKEEGTTPVVEVEVSKLPEDAKNKSTTNWGNIIMATAAIVVAVVALILVGQNHGHNK